jgi:hypothetical protein
LAERLRILLRSSDNQDAAVDVDLIFFNAIAQHANELRPVFGGPFSQLSAGFFGLDLYLAFSSNTICHLASPCAGSTICERRIACCPAGSREKQRQNPPRFLNLDPIGQNLSPSQRDAIFFLDQGKYIIEINGIIDGM